MILVNSCTNTSTLCSTSTTVGFVEFDGCSTHSSQCISEDRAQEHISLSCMDFLNVHTHLLHDFHAIAETEYNTFLRSTYDVGTIMLVEVQATDRTTHFLVFKHSFCSISEWNDLDSFTADGYLRSQLVHICVTDVWSDVFVNPSIENTSSVDAE